MAFWRAHDESLLSVSQTNTGLVPLSIVTYGWWALTKLAGLVDYAEHALRFGVPWLFYIGMFLGQLSNEV